MRYFKYWLVGFGLVASLSLVAFYLSVKHSSHIMGSSHQSAKAELVQKKLDQFAIVSNLISRFVQEDLRDAKSTKPAIEKNLRQYLKSSPAEVIFGIGVWFKPYAFDGHTRLFGPYVHRGDPKNHKLEDVMTYEWNTEAYNYPNQDWYKAGIAMNGESAFVEPYFDSGLVYVTNSRVFYNTKNEVIGVISVDMILPQLQELVASQSEPGLEHVLILNRAGQLLAHPLKEAFFEKKKITDGQENQSLLNYSPEQLNEGLHLDHSSWIKTAIVQEQLGWKIVIESSESSLYPDLQRYRESLLFSFLFLWGIILGALKILSQRDHERKLSAEKIEQGRSQLVQSAKMAALGEMASGVAHEINNPLTIIIGKVHIVERILRQHNIQQDEAQKALLKITETAERIGRIISGLRSFSRSGDQDPFMREKLQRVVDDTISLCAERFRNNGIVLKIGAVPDVELNCRLTQISQVFLNILSNAFDAVQAQPLKEVEIQFTFDDATKRLNIIFTDTGPGIPAGIAKSIMQPFFTTKPVGKGTGLGLSISTGIIEDHHGCLILDQSSAKTKFIITLPYFETSFEAKSHAVIISTNKSRNEA